MPAIARLALPDAALRVLSSSGWLIGAQLLQMLAMLASAAVAARVLGSAAFGVYGTASTILATAYTLMPLGTQQILERQAATDAAREGEATRIAWTINLIGAGLLLVPMIVLLRLTAGATIDWPLIVLMGVSLGLASADALTLVFFARTNGRRIAATQALAAAFTLVARLSVLASGGGIKGLIVSLFVERMVLSALLWRQLRRYHPDISVSLAPAASIAPPVREGLVVLLSTIAIALSARADLVIISTMLSDRDAGIYFAASRLAEAWYLVPTLVCRSLLPTIAQMHVRSAERYAAALDLSYTAVFWSGACFAVAVAVAAPVLLYVLFGPDYASGAAVLAIGGFGGIFVGYGQVTRQAANIERSQVVLLYATIAGALMCFVLNIILLPTLGITGAAITRVLVLALQGWLFTALFPSTRKIFIRMTLAPFRLRHLAELTGRKM